MAKVNTKTAAVAAPAAGAQEYLVIRPWHGVKKGQVLKLEKVHPSLKANVMLLSKGDLTPATPDAANSGAKSENDPAKDSDPKKDDESTKVTKQTP